MGQILFVAGIIITAIGVSLLLVDALTLKKRRIKMLDEIQKDYS